MNGRKAKKIRKQVYWNMADIRSYVKDANGTVRNTGLRKKYLEAKRVK
jgi:hypothetical protein